MTLYKRGDVVLVPFPFTDLTTTKQRPALIISSNAYNERHADVIVVAITSRPPRTTSEDVIILSQEEIKTGGLLKASNIIVGKIVTLDQRIIRRKIGRLSASTRKKLQTKIAAILLN